MISINGFLILSKKESDILREIHVNEITAKVAELCIKACVEVAQDIRACMLNSLDAGIGLKEGKYVCC